MQRRPVCAIEDLPPGSMKLVQAGKFGVGVYNIDGSLYAIANYCSHEGPSTSFRVGEASTRYSKTSPPLRPRATGRRGCRRST